MADEVIVNVPADPRYIDVSGAISLIEGQTLVYDQDAVLNAIYNLLETSRGEREFRPEIYANLSDALFDPIDDDTAFNIRNAMVRAIEVWEPRVTLDGPTTKVIADRSMDGYRCTIGLVIEGLPQNNTFTFLLKRQYGS